LDEKIMAQTLKQGYEARMKIIEVMKTAIDKPREELSPYAPRIESFYIDIEKIGDVIGPGGKVIRRLTDEYEVTIDIADDGLVTVCGHKAETLQQAVELIKMMTREFAVGETFVGKVLRMMDFGAIVELSPYHDGLVHVSEMAPYRVGSPEDILKKDDLVNVRIKEIDTVKGKISLTMVGLPENEKYWAKGQSDNGGGGFRNDFPRGRGGFRR